MHGVLVLLTKNEGLTLKSGNLGDLGIKNSMSKAVSKNLNIFVYNLVFYNI